MSPFLFLVMSPFLFPAINGLVLNGTGTILVAGSASNLSGSTENMLAEYTLSGGLIASGTTSMGVSSSANALIAVSNTTALEAGTESDSSGNGYITLAQYDLTTTTTASLTFDNNGNTTTDQNGNTYTYDAWNRLVTETPPGSIYSEEIYTYNALGERVTTQEGVQPQSSVPVLVINDGAPQRSMIDSLTLVFSQDVSSVAVSSLSLVNTSTSTTFAFICTNPSGDEKTWVLNFSADSGLQYESLPNGIYELTVTGSGVSYTAGGTMAANQTYTFDRLFGDFEGNGTVNYADYELVDAQYEQPAGGPGYEWYMDRNDLGEVTVGDIQEVEGDFGTVYTFTNSGPIMEGPNTPQGLTANGILSALQPRDLYYSSQWQVIQESVTNTIVTFSGTMTCTTTQTQTADQYVWGEAYVNELVLRDSDTLGNASSGTLGVPGTTTGLNERLYALQDANYNVTALVNTSGTVIERFSYDPYGNVTVLTASGQQTTDAYSWVYMYQGGRIDPVTGLYEFQQRDYSPTLGRWFEQDPAGYADGANLYEMCRDDPLVYNDPLGNYSIVSRTDSDGDIHYALINWLHPSGEGQPCCCDDPAPITAHITLKGSPLPFKRGGSLYTTATVTLTGSYIKDISYAWWTCIRADKTANIIPAAIDSLRAFIPQPLYPFGPTYFTDFYVRFLACEDGKLKSFVAHAGGAWVSGWFGYSFQVGPLTTVKPASSYKEPFIF